MFSTLRGTAHSIAAPSMWTRRAAPALRSVASPAARRTLAMSSVARDSSPSSPAPSTASSPSQPSATASSSSSRPLRVLALESSADDTCAAIVTSERQVLANVVMKQHNINTKFGGIHPIMAQEAHMRNMPVAIEGALKTANLTLTDLDAIAYTRGPGMFGCLTISATSAKALSAAAGVPLVGVHHMQAHALTPLLTEAEPPQFPFFILLVSGGHTQLVLAESMHKFKIIMATLDNCMGDAFDKTARLLQLPPSETLGYGPVLEEYAARAPLPPFDTEPLKELKRPLSANKTANQLAFSFAGLLHSTEKLAKSAFSNLKMKIPLNVQQEVSRRFQEAAVGHVVDKVRLAISASDVPVKGVVVSGGVGSNQYLREQMREMLDSIGPEPIPLAYPPIPLCTDNAAMIGWAAILRLQQGLIGEGFDLPIRKKWSLEDLYDDVPESAYRQ